MNEMKFRKILIWIGGGMFAMSALTVILQIFSFIQLQELLSDGLDVFDEGDGKFKMLLSLKIISSFLSLLYNWAISALCFFAAHMISPLWPKQSPKVSD